ncbi:NADPH:quinone reductase-like Zn-dependent oxidoreductase [Pseudarthrobacter sp. W1I19]|uniref:hypothetical protein n=1 Tax=Pseudarthrobacter sp. W1I19 TaxID=3042288 RepID=UPI002788C4FA|nr:hypothetical protein [Pseudarthrobacter sp. W1I19]MDQ0923426.1 NADPH:quinone reductase-like Zn-dependent oxidoreductase [Pseudarthrobacter sp. W1I19]
MKAAVYRRFGSPDVVLLDDQPKPTPRRGELLVRVQATTVSAADYRARTKHVPQGLKLLSSVTLGIITPRTPVLGMDAPFYATVGFVAATILAVLLVAGADLHA